MNVTNFEFKVRAGDINKSEERLKELHPSFKGEDHQVDTYYSVPRGRLKLREGNIENALIYYERTDIAAAKQSNILLYRHQPAPSLKQILKALFSIKIVIDKRRRIYFLDNVKFHFDTVAGLGTFVEVEAIDDTGAIGIDKLKAQCDRYFTFFGFKDSDYVNCSYSDLMKLPEQPEAVKDAP